MTREIKPVIHLEQLEPRILLSGDSLLNIAPNPQQDTILDNTSLTDQYAELLDTQEPVEEQISLEPAPSDTTNTDVYQPICTLFVDDDNTNDESVDADLSIDNIGPAQTGDVLAVLSNYFDTDIESKVGTTEDGNMPTYINDADLSIEYVTSIEIRGPPASDSLESDSISVTLEDVAFQAENTVLDEYTDVVQTQSVELPGLYLLDPDVGYFGGPVIYLDFDGAQDITYNGPVVVEGIDIPEFSADTAGLTGQEQQIISQILIELERTFQGSGVIFTSTEPDFGTEYSTIFIGGDDAAFRAYGRFWGLSEKVDVGNQDPGDDALVFSEVIASCDLDKEVFAKSLADVIAHETAHLLGYSHDSSGSNGGILAPVAINVSVLAGEFLINQHTAGDQVNVSVDADSAGNYVAVWQGANIHGWGTNEIHLQRYNAEGTPMGQEQQVNPDWQGEQTNPDVAVADDGTFVVSWTTDNDGDSYGVNTRLFEVDGTPVSGAFLVNTHTSDSQSDSEVAIDRTTGEFVVVWASSGQDGYGRGVYGQRFAADGTPVGDEFQVNTHTDNDQSNPMVAMDADGDFVVTWQSDGQDGSSWGVYGQRFAADGTPVGDEFQVNTYTSSEQRNAAIAMDEAGKFVIAWHSSNNQDGSSWGIYAQRYSTDGTPDGTEFLVNTYTSNTQAGPAIAMDTDGSHIIAWHSYTQDGSSYGIYAQGYASDGTALGGEFRANTYTSSDQQTPAVTVGANGDFLIAWQSRNQDGSVWGI